MDEIKSEGKQVQQDYLQILDDILQKILEKGQFQGLDSKKDISILVGKELKYKGNPNGEVAVNLMSAEIVEKLNTAINDVKNLKGSVRIMIGKNIAFHAKNGEILTDKLGLANEIKQNLTQVADPVQKSLSIEDLKKQVEALQQKVQDQQAVIDRFVQQENSSVESTQKLSTDLANLKQAFDTQQKTIEQLQKGLEAINKQNLPAIKNEILTKWLNSIESKAKNTAKNLYEQVKTALTPKVDKVKAQLETQITTLKEQINQQMESLRTEMKSQLATIKSEFEAQVGVVKDGIAEVKQLASNEVQYGIERHQAATSAIQSKISEEVNTVHKQVTKAVGDIHSRVNHTVKENVEKVTNSVMEVKGKAFSKSIDSMLRLFGNQNSDGSRSYESKNYNFYQKGDSITVTAKDGRAVMVNNSLTTQATEKDVESLEEVGQVVSDYLKNSYTQSQSQSIKPRR